MSRRNITQRLANALPLAVVVLGAGLAAARKRRAGRHARRELRDPVVTSGQVPEPHLAAPLEGSFEPSDLAPSVVVTTVEVRLDEGDEVATVIAGSSPTPTAAAARGARGATTANVLEALAKGGTMTAGEVALATGIGRATVSSTLSRLARTGAVTKADRGYQLPGDGAKPAGETSSKRRAPAKRRAAKATSTPKAPPKVSSRRTTRSGAAPGATKAKVLAALTTDIGLTASEVAKAAGLGRGTVSTTLSKLAKNGEVVKAERGYRLPA